MPTIEYPFTNPANYTFDNNKAEVAGSKVQLKRQPSADDFTQNFDNDSGFTYDPTFIEFIGGTIRQKDQRPANATFYAHYNNTINGTWGGGTMTATGVGSPGISGGRLDLKGGTVKYVDYAYLNNADLVQTGCIRFTVVPNYTGSPQDNRTFISVLKGGGSTENYIALRNRLTGESLWLDIWTAAGVADIQVNLGTWAPVLGTPYEFEINFDVTTGATRLFIDGVQFGSTITTTMARDTDLTTIRVGSEKDGNERSNFEIDDLIIFSEVQHTANYTPGATIPPYKYETANVIPPNFVVGAPSGFLTSIDGMTATYIGFPRYIFSVDGGNYQYWTGTAWADSDETFDQTIDLATANINLPALAVTGATTFNVKVMFTNTNVTQSSVDTINIANTGFGSYPIDDPTIIPTTTFSQDALLTFLATLTATGSDAIQFIIRIDGQDKYWDGAAWSNSNGTFAQSNDLAIVQTNLSMFTDRGITMVVIFLHSDDGSTTPDINDLTISFDFFGGPTIPENVCTVWGFLYDELNDPVVGATISVTPTRFGLINDKVIDKTPKTVTTDSNGYWEIKLIETQTSNNIWAYVFNINGFKSTKLVPYLDSAEFNTLVQGFP